MKEVDQETELIKEIVRSGSILDFTYKKNRCVAYRDSLSDCYLYYVFGNETIYGFRKDCKKKELKRFLKDTVNEMLEEK